MLKFEAKKGDFPKIWQKLGLQPPGSAAHDELKNAFLYIQAQISFIRI